jgi:hypothetical protein
MAELAKGLLRKKIPELELALEGKLEEHHRFLLELQLQRLEAAEKDLAALEQRIRQLRTLTQFEHPGCPHYPSAVVSIS